MFFKKKEIDFLAIGDLVTDAFIDLEEAWLEDDNPQKDKELCMKFSQKLPYKDVTVVKAVGNSPNASVSAHRLGLKSYLMTNIGDDDFGKEDLEALKAEGIPTDYVKVHKGMGSNYHYVLRLGAERTILVKHYEYPYKLDIDVVPKWIYLSSLAENSLPFHEALADYLEEHPETKLALQPGTFQMKLGKEKLGRLYKEADLFFCNVEEARQILDMPGAEVKELLKGMREIGPKMPIITDGPAGAYAYDGEEMWHMPMYPDPAPPVDRTGAGDSFASTFTSAIILGKSVPEALSWGPINSMSVVQHIGAQKGLLSREQIEEYLKNAPADYKPEKIN